MRISDWSSDVCSSDLALGAAKHPAVQQAAGRRQEVGERHLEDLIDLAGLGAQLEGRPQQTDHRNYNEAGAHDVGVEPSDQRHVAVSEADLLLRLAQSAGLGVGVAGVDAAAGKADLPGVDRKSTRLNSSH